MCPTASFLATGGFKVNLFPNACMVYKHTVVAAFCIYAQRGEDAAKGEVGGHALNSHENYIVDHGISWKNHGIVFLNFCGNPVCLSFLCFRALFKRVTSFKLSAKKMKFFFKKHLEFEEKHGDDSTVAEVKQKALDYVESQGYIDD